MDETWDQTAIERVEPEQAEMVWEDMERKKVEREEMRREEVGQAEVERKKVEAEGGVLILGIPVYVDDRRFRGLAREVLGHIGDRYPEDLDTIRRRVSRIEPMRPGEMPPEVAASYGRLAHGAPECLSGRPEAMGGPVKVSSRMIEGPRAGLIGILAHELGHAVSTQDDIMVRSRLGEEWGDELAADHHAAKWGFGRVISSLRRASRSRAGRGGCRRVRGTPYRLARHGRPRTGVRWSGAVIGAWGSAGRASAVVASRRPEPAECPAIHRKTA